MIASPSQAVEILHVDCYRVINAINDFTSRTFVTRGGRLGSGMGSLIEAMWVYYMNQVLFNDGGISRECEIGWLQDHEPADYACLYRGVEWLPNTKQGELFRIEAKSMNVGVDEAKGHFTNLIDETDTYDQLLILIWNWEDIGNYYSYPKILDYFIGNSRDIIQLRDTLHLARNGSFVQSGACPDGCDILVCSHVGEPLNSEGARERRSGPITRKPPRVEYAGNFGGLVRMIKTNNDYARQQFRQARRSSSTIHRYISFIHENFPNEELNHFKRQEWEEACIYIANIDPKLLTKEQIRNAISQTNNNYRDILKDMF